MQSYGFDNTLTPPVSDYINNYALVANTPTFVNWPSGAAFANISGSSDYWVSAQASAAVPSVNNTNGSGAALNASQRKRAPGATGFWIISATAHRKSRGCRRGLIPCRRTSIARGLKPLSGVHHDYL